LKNMSKKEETALGAEPDGQSTDSVYDFLYHDARRVGSFLAQFDYFGHLQQVTSSETASKGTKHGYSLKIAGNAPVPGVPDGAEGSITFGRDPAQSGSEAQARVYDPLWTNARSLLDYLDERQLIQRDLTTARLGQFVIASGALSILNMEMMPKIWETTGIRDMWVRQSVENAKKQWQADPQIAALRASEKDKVERAAIKIAETNALGAMQVLSKFPHSVQCTVTGTNFSVWSTLTSEGMVGTVADLSLKHGTEIPGEWHLLGVLDAMPNPVQPQIPMANTGTPTHLGVLIKNLSNLGRTLLGRPPEAYGVTALLLFRDVSAGLPAIARSATAG
jgi:hypothetical protein